MSGYFVRNRETGKVELHFDRAAYAALPPEAKAELKRACLWAPSRSAWVSRGRLGSYAAGLAADLARRLGLGDRGETGERPSFSEQLARRAGRAEEKAERCERRAERAGRRAEALQADFNRFRKDTAFLTQPAIAGRFARFREKVMARYERGFEELAKCRRYRERAEELRRSARQDQLDDPAFLDRRLREIDAELRGIARRVERHPDGEAYLARLQERAEELLDKRAFYQGRLDAVGGVRYSRENVRPGDVVLVRGDWAVVVKANPATFTVERFGLTLRYRYAEIKGKREGC